MTTTVLRRLVAASQVVFALGGLIGLVAEAIDDPGYRGVLATALAVVAFGTTTVAGVQLWRGRRSGFALSIGVQALQSVVLIAHGMALRFVAGPQVTLPFGQPRIWEPWGVEGSFVAFRRPEFPTWWMGVNVVALAVAVYLAWELRALGRAPAAITSSTPVDQRP